MKTRAWLGIGTACVLLAAAVAAQEPSAPAAAAGSPPSVAKDPIEGTRWLGTITSPTGATQLGLEFRRSPRGDLYVLAYLPVMHVFEKPTSLVRVQGGDYFMDFIAARAHHLAIVGGRDFLLHAYALADGRETWRQHFWTSWIESTPRVVDGVLYIGSSDLRAVRALDPHNGAVLWSTDVYGSAWGSPLVTKDTIYMGTAGTKDYVIDHRAAIVALDRKSGQIRWRRPEPQTPDSPMWGHAGSLALAGDLILATGLDGTLLALPAK